MSLAWPIDVGHSIGKRGNWHILHIWFYGVDLVATRPVLNRFQDLGGIRLHNYSVANTRTINDRWCWYWSSCNKTCFELVSRFCEFDTFYMFEGCNNVVRVGLRSSYLNLHSKSNLDQVQKKVIGHRHGHKYTTVLSCQTVLFRPNRKGL